MEFCGGREPGSTPPTRGRPPGGRRHPHHCPTASGDIKLADLGLAKHAETSLNLTEDGGCLGAPNFMAPEQFRNARRVDRRSDVYGLAATLYMAVTGQLPFAGSNLVDCCMRKSGNDLPPPRKLNPSLSEWTDWAIRRAMSAEPAGRPASCAEFVEDLTGRSANVPGARKGVARPDLWYLVYEDTDGVSHQTSGPLQDIRRSLQEKLLGDAGKVRVSASRDGTFEPLRSFSEFRDLVAPPVPLPTPGAAEDDGGTGRPCGAVPKARDVPASTGEAGDVRGAPTWLPGVIAAFVGLTGFLLGLYLLPR